ncbi:hypothetical protein MKX01_039869 [Papaver californicum]|nr:hypothetical protein MKX01_039869 [Papaver californicum]
MNSETHNQLHVFFLPLMAYGHMIPTIDVARLFAARGVKATIIATPRNASTSSKLIDRDRLSGLDIHIRVIPFPAKEAGLPQGTENLDDITSPELISNFSKAVQMLQLPFENLVQELRPNVIVADMFIPWAAETAGKFLVPRIAFHGTCLFSLCVSESLRSFQPDITDQRTFLVPGLPDKIEMTMSELPEESPATTEFAELVERIRESEMQSYGAIVNSVSRISSDQLVEIAMGLEDSEIPFVWVIRKLENSEKQILVPKGFEDRIKGKDLIIN